MFHPLMEHLYWSSHCAHDASADNALRKLQMMEAEQMNAFKSGARVGSVMPQLAKGFSDAQITELAAWFERAPALAR